MKTINAIVKVVTALAAVAGAVYLVAVYGDKIVAWAKGIMAKCPCCANEVPAEEAVVDEAPAAVEEAPAAEEAPVEETPVDEAPAAVEEAPAAVEEDAPIADESDFEG